MFIAERALAIIEDLYVRIDELEHAEDARSITALPTDTRSSELP